MEIKSNFKSLIIWCIGVFFLVASGMAKYAGMEASEQSINTLMNQLPKPIQSILGLGAFDLTKALGYYGLLFAYLAIMATIHASMLGADIISKEERDKTSEFLFVKPISRSKIITSKLLAALLNIIVFNLVTLFSSLIIVGYYAKGEAITNDILTLMAGMFILQLMFLFIGTGIAAISKRPKVAASFATGILLFTFILSIAIDMNDRLANLKYLTPFKYFDAKNLIDGRGLDPFFVTISGVIIVIMFVSTYIFYNKRDLNILLVY